jgi:hypothetical protein
MNSGYGKFGQNPNQTDLYLVNKNEELLNQDYEIEYDNKMNAFIRKKDIFNNRLHYNLFIATLITSYSRFYLWKMIQYCLNHNIDVFYVDTDSITINNNNISKLAKFKGNSLGKWQIEQKFDTFQAIDSKEYFSFSNNNFNAKFKGIKNRLINQPNKLKNHYEHGTKTNLVGTIFYTKFRKSNPNSVHIVKKHKRNYYSKRLIKQDLTSNPLRVSQIKNEEIMNKIENNNKEKIKKIINNINNV